MTLNVPTSRSIAYQSGSFALFLAAASILGAWGFEYAGYLPCPLCLEQRWAYYAGIPVLFAALALVSGGSNRAATWLFAHTLGTLDNFLELVVALLQSVLYGISMQIMRRRWPWLEAGKVLGSADPSTESLISKIHRQGPR